MILDIGISFINGLEICREIKRRDEAIKVIIMSGDAGENTKEAAFNSGAEAFIAKPFSPVELNACVKRLLA